MKETLARVTRADVAQAANVTETIVSYVVNNNRYVAYEKRQRVQEAIKKLGYRPNKMARALKGKKTNHILFVVDDVQSEHFGAIINEVNRLAYDKGYFISLCGDYNDSEFVQRIYDGFFDGVVIGSALFSPENIQKLINYGIPVIVLEIRDYENIEGVFGRINTGLYDAARNCIQTLYEKGRRNILYLAGLEGIDKSDFVDASEFRYRGYVDQMTEYNLPCGAENIISEYKSDEELIEHIKERFLQENHPDGIFARTDYLACAAIDGVKQAGLSVPHDVSVIGFNNSTVCSYVNPKLSSVHIDRKTVAQKIFDLLQRLIEKKEEKQSENKSLKVILQSQVIMRESV